MSSKCELDDGIKSIKSAWRREHTARANLEKMLEQAESENAKLREVLESCVVLLTDHQFLNLPELWDETLKAMRELGIEVPGDGTH